MYVQNILTRPAVFHIEMRHVVDIYYCMYICTMYVYVYCCYYSHLVEEATKTVSLKLAEFSEPRFYHQFG